MGQTPSSPVRQDNASTRTLHSSSLNSRRPTSFFRRLTRRLHSHPARRFGRQRHNPASGNRTRSSAIQNETSSRRRPPESTSSSASTTSSVRRATVAATRAAAAATGPLPPLPSFNVDSHFIPPSTASSAASTNSAISNTSDLSHMLSEIIASAVLSALPSNRSQQQQQQQQDNTSSATTENDHGNSFFRYVQMPLRSQHSSSEQSQEQQQQQQSGSQQTSDQQQRVLPIIIVGYRTSPTSSSSAATNDPPQSGSNRRPRSTLSTSSSLATLQSMPLSVHSNRTAATTQQQQQQPSTTTSSSNTAAADPGQWVIYVLSGQPMNTTISTLPDNPTYEDLLWLSNIIGPARPVTTTQAAIDATLPVTPWSDDTKRRMRGAERCLVCLDDFVPKQSVRVLKCCHVFHKECVDRWLCETHNSCPICRGVPVDPQFVEQEQAQ